MQKNGRIDSLARIDRLCKAASPVPSAPKSDLAPRTGRGSLISGALELERHAELGAVGLYLSLGVQLHVELDDLRDAQFSQRFPGLLDRVGGGLFPGVAAGADQFNDLVDALRHLVLPFAVKRAAGAPRCRRD